MKFSGIQKTSLIDYPDNVSTVLFTAGCNLRCPYCHNWRIVLSESEPEITEEEAIGILEQRKGFIDHVVISGGEPTLQGDLPQFLSRLKSLNYKVKLDTNGMQPEALRECLPYLDYVAVDVKTSIERYSGLGAAEPETLITSINLLRDGDVNYEFRCTVVPGFVDLDSVRGMGEMVRGAKRFVFQQYIPTDTLDPTFNKTTYNIDAIQGFAEAMRKYVADTQIRA